MFAPEQGDGNRGRGENEELKRDDAERNERDTLHVA